MAFEITQNALLSTKNLNINPQLVLKIDGVPTLYGAVEIDKLIKIGDPLLLIGGGWKIGGLSPVEDQGSYIMLKGTSAEITQQLDIGKGIGTSVSSLGVSLVDKNKEITNLITPGNVVADILGRRARLYIGFKGTAWPEDYITIFKGIIDEITSGPGNVLFNLASPDQNKRQTIYPKVSPTLNGAIDNSVTSLTVDDTTNIFNRVLGPAGTHDSNAKTYIRIEDEIIEFTGTTPTTITGLTRGALGTIADSHADQTNVDTFYRIGGNVMELALKIMLSGWNGPFVTGVAATNFNQIDLTTNVPNSIFFKGVDLFEQYGLVDGDYISTSGASNGANNVTLKQIINVNVIDEGTYITVSGVSFVDELLTSAVVSFRSQYDTLPDGLKMQPEDVDIKEHLRLFRLFLSSASYDFYLTDDVDAKSFLDDQIYNPYAAFSIPRKAKSSVGYHIGPLPSQGIGKLDSTNIIHPDKIVMKRGLSKNFYNTIIYKYDYDALDGKPKSGNLTTSGTSLSRIDVGIKALTIEAQGIRSSLQGKSQTNIAAERRLKRYEFGAEYFNAVQVSFRDSFRIEIGDVVILDSTDINISDTKTGTRNPFAKLYEIYNKSLNWQTGNVRLDLVDTNFSLNSRYGLISPSSKIKSASNASQFVIESSFASIYGDNEYLKWTKYNNAPVKIRNSDFSILGNSIIKSINGNLITLETPLAFTPLAGYIMELSNYDVQTDEVKIRNVFMRDTTFPDGKRQYQMV